MVGCQTKHSFRLRRLPKGYNRLHVAFRCRTDAALAFYQEAPHSGQDTLLLAWFAITWNDRTGVVPPADIDVIMVAPKGSGTSLRTMFLEGRGLNSSYAVYQDASGHATERCLPLVWASVRATCSRPTSSARLPATLLVSVDL